MSRFWSRFRRPSRKSGPGDGTEPSWYAEERAAWDRERLMLYAKNGEQLQYFNFVRDVLDIFYRADCRESLLWHVTDGKVYLSVDVSDVFDWESVDFEDITFDTFPVLKQTFDDLTALGGSSCAWLHELYAARVRGMRPQGYVYPPVDFKKTFAPEAPGIAALFDACGPERVVNCDNPWGRPEYKPKEA